MEFLSVPNGIIVCTKSMKLTLIEYSFDIYNLKIIYY